MMFNKKYVKNVLCITAIVVLSACSWKIVPTLPYGTPFPLEKAANYPLARGTAAMCVDDDYNGENVHKILNDSSYNEVTKNPNGKGKIYKMYLAYKRDAPKMYGDYKLLIGVNFTIHTTDNDIVTECYATEQVLGSTY